MKAVETTWELFIAMNSCFSLSENICLCTKLLLKEAPLISPDLNAAYYNNLTFACKLLSSA